MVPTATRIGHTIQMLNRAGSMIRTVASQLLEIINPALVENDANDQEAILACINRHDIGSLKREATSWI